MRRHTRFGGRTLARSQALQLLFQAEATRRMVVDILASAEYALSDGPLDPYAEMLATGADAMIDDLDAVMEITSSNWGVSRMPAVDRNLLRLAIYEMLEVDEVDVAVSIDEFVELAKAYGTDESPRFVNGLLGRVARLMEEGVDVVAYAHEQLAEREEARDDDDKNAPEENVSVESSDDAEYDEDEYDDYDEYDEYEEVDSADDYDEFEGYGDYADGYAYGEDARPVGESSADDLPSWAQED